MNFTKFHWWITCKCIKLFKKSVKTFLPCFFLASNNFFGSYCIRHNVPSDDFAFWQFLCTYSTKQKLFDAAPVGKSLLSNEAYTGELFVQHWSPAAAHKGIILLKTVWVKATTKPYLTPSEQCIGCIGEYILN